MASKHLPFKWVKIRSTDNPWIEQDTRDKIEIRLAVFHREGRSDEWKKLKAITNTMIRNRKRKFYDTEVEKLKAKGSHTIPFKILRNVTGTERPPEWSVEDMREGTDMPVVVRSDSDTEELVFLSPEEEVIRQPAGEQGASQVLRRSNRKRKSVTAYCDPDMSKGLGSKKKKGSSPEAKKKTADTEGGARSMPKIPRTPGGKTAQPNEKNGAGDNSTPGASAEQPPAAPAGLEALLLGMEGRLITRMDATNKAVDEAVDLNRQTNAALALLERKVDANEVKYTENVRESEERILKRVDEKVQSLVHDDLKGLGFDTQLTAGALTTLNQTGAGTSRSYAGVLSAQPNTQAGSVSWTEKSHEERREDRFWMCRRSLRIWPVPGGELGSLKDYLRDKLKLDEDFVEDLGEIRIEVQRDPKSKIKNEVCVTFHTKEVRDFIKSKASALANFGDSVGMRLHIPNYLQKDFRSLMSVAYDLKKRIRILNAT